MGSIILQAHLSIKLELVISFLVKAVRLRRCGGTKDLDTFAFFFDSTDIPQRQLVATQPHIPVLYGGKSDLGIFFFSLKKLAQVNHRLFLLSLKATFWLVGLHKGYTQLTTFYKTLVTVINQGHQTITQYRSGQNCVPWDKFGLLPIVQSKVLLEHNLIHLFLYIICSFFCDAPSRVEQL